MKAIIEIDLGINEPIRLGPALSTLLRAMIRQLEAEKERIKELGAERIKELEAERDELLRMASRSDAPLKIQLHEQNKALRTALEKIRDKHTAVHTRGGEYYCCVCDEYAEPATVCSTYRLADEALRDTSTR